MSFGEWVGLLNDAKEVGHTFKHIDEMATTASLLRFDSVKTVRRCMQSVVLYQGDFITGDMQSVSCH